MLSRTLLTQSSVLLRSATSGVASTSSKFLPASTLATASASTTAPRWARSYASASPGMEAKGLVQEGEGQPDLSLGSSGGAGVARKEADPQLAGYPELPFVSLQKRVPKGWWDQQERKNFGETMHEQEDALSMWSPDVHAMPAGWAFTQMLIAFSAIAGFGCFIYATRPERPVAKRSYPYEGLRTELGGSEATPKANPEVFTDDE